MQLRTYYPTVVLSDIHLGTHHSKTIEVTDFLTSIDCGRLILNGDIIDGWHLQKDGLSKWKKKTYRVFQGNHENDGEQRYGGYLCSRQS